MISFVAVKAPKNFWSINERLAKISSRLLAIKKPIVVNVVFLSVDKAKALNWQLRKRRYVPDVLSLNFSTKQKINKDGFLPFLGELYICLPQVQKQAKENKKSVQSEMAWVLVHGLLHLWGYDHEQENQGRLMRKLEQQILQGLEIGK